MYDDGYTDITNLDVGGLGFHSSLRISSRPLVLRNSNRDDGRAP